MKNVFDNMFKDDIIHMKQAGILTQEEIDEAFAK